MYLQMEWIAYVTYNFTSRGHRQSRRPYTLSRKQFKIETLLLRTTNKKWRMFYRLASFPYVLAWLLRSFTYRKSFFEYFFRTVVQKLTRCQLT